MLGFLCCMIYFLQNLYEFYYNPGDLYSGSTYCNRRSPLHDAIDNNNPETVRYLLDDLNATTTTPICRDLMEDEICSYSPLAFAKRKLQSLINIFKTDDTPYTKNGAKIVDILEEEAESRNPTCPDIY